MLLADLGAEVIKVEPVRGDSMRMAGMPFVGCQRGKLDIAVDVKAPEGLEAVMRLAEIADVVHHNMTKGTAARLGIDYESLKARNPDLVHCNTYAYGAEGPLSDFGGLDPLYQACVRPRVRGGSGGRRQPAPLSPLRDDRHRQCHGVCRRGARRPVPPTSYRRGTGPLDVAPQRRGHFQFRRLPCRGGARPGSSRSRPTTRWGSHPAAGSTRPRRGGSRWPRSDLANGLSCAVSWATRTSSDMRRSRPRRGPVRDRVGARGRLPHAHRGGLVPRPRATAVWRWRSPSTPTTARPCSTTPTTSASASWRNIPIRSWDRCASSAR